LLWTKHDVYGEKFVKAWEEREIQEVVEDNFNIDSLNDALFDFQIIDE
jgi:hypothetical protein